MKLIQLVVLTATADSGAAAGIPCIRHFPATATTTTASASTTTPTKVTGLCQYFKSAGTHEHIKERDVN